MSKIKNIYKIQKTIIDFANGDFHKRLELLDNNSDLDTILAGINMLGEELEDKTISRDYFSSIFNSVSDVLIVFNSKGIITDVNLASEEAFQTAKENIISLYNFRNAERSLKG